MKHIGKEVDRIIKEKRLVKKELAKELGLAESYFVQLQHNANMDCEKLEKICKLLNVSPAFFFDEWPEESEMTLEQLIEKRVISENSGERRESLEALTKIIDSLHLLIVEKDERLKEKERLIGILLAQKESQNS